jgi:hypothetical protein
MITTISTPKLLLGLIVYGHDLTNKFQLGVVMINHNSKQMFKAVWAANVGR